MIIACDCGAKLKIDDARIADGGIKVRCPRCGVVLAVHRPPATPEDVPPKKVPASAEPTGPAVLIAHDSDVVSAMIRDILSDAGFRVHMASNGNEVLEKISVLRPRGLVLDVGLPGIYGFELCARIKQNPDTATVKIVLVSSVYDSKRYKRTPESLYGADDYVEKHHIHDLPSKLSGLFHPADKEKTPADGPKARTGTRQNLPEMSRPPARQFEPSLLSPENVGRLADEVPESISSPFMSTPPPKEKPLTPESFSLEASIFQKEECDLLQVDEADPEAVEKARRFARIIVSDVALYNQEAVINGIKSGTFYELLKNDIQEGRELYEKRVPAAIRRIKDHYQEAFDNFIASAERKLRGSD